MNFKLGEVEGQLTLFSKSPKCRTIFLMPSQKFVFAQVNTKKGTFTLGQSFFHLVQKYLLSNPVKVIGDGVFRVRRDLLSTDFEREREKKRKEKKMRNKIKVGGRSQPFPNKSYRIQRSRTSSTTLKLCVRSQVRDIYLLSRRSRVRGQGLAAQSAKTKRNPCTPAQQTLTEQK